MAATAPCPTPGSIQMRLPVDQPTWTAAWWALSYTVKQQADTEHALPSPLQVARCLQGRCVQSTILAARQSLTKDSVVQQPGSRHWSVPPMVSALWLNCDLEPQFKVTVCHVYGSEVWPGSCQMQLSYMLDRQFLGAARSAVLGRSRMCVGRGLVERLCNDLDKVKQTIFSIQYKPPGVWTWQKSRSVCTWKLTTIRGAMALVELSVCGGGHH